MKKIKIDRGVLLAIAVSGVILGCGYFIGKTWAFDKVSIVNNNYLVNTTTKRIEQVKETTTMTTTKQTLTEVLNNSISSVDSLCGADTGICNKTVGYVNLNNQKLELSIYYDYDNYDQNINYFKIGDTKVGDFVKFSYLYNLNNHYLMIVEDNNNDNKYIIHFYNNEGKESKTFDATYNNGEVNLIDNLLYYYYCDANDKDVSGNKALNYYSITETNNELVNNLVSKEYKC
jgi:hypothetical protein